MKRTIIIWIVLIGLVLIATNLLLDKSDYHGKISEMNKGNFSLTPLKIDPEAQYNLQTIYYEKNTKVVGKVNKVDDLKENQEVKVWVEEGTEKKLTYKIEVISE